MGLLAAGSSCHRCELLDLHDQVLVEYDLVQYGPEADAFLAEDLDESSTSLLGGGIAVHLVFEELEGVLIHVVAEAGN